MALSPKNKTRCHRIKIRPRKLFSPGAENFYLYFRGLISWLLIKLPLGKLSRAEEERLDRLTNWGRW